MSSGLNKEQQEATFTTEGALLVLAGAGSGKTRVVTFRIAHLLEKGIPASQILGLTFTNKAAAEMRDRVHKLTQSDVLICTFHSLGSRILRESIHWLGYQRSFTIYDEHDVDHLLKTCLEGLPKLDLKAVRHGISKAKNSFILPNEEHRLPHIDEVGSLFPQIYKTYQAKLQECNALDYDDLLFLTARLFREHPEVLAYYQQRWSHLLIDEYQDTNELQYSIINDLVAKHHNICVVGDPDQSIYSWRGANIKNILNFERDYPGAKVVRLDQNYRSRSNILQAANAVISHNGNRYEKHLWSDLGPGEKIKLHRCDNEQSEARFIAERIVTHHREQQIPLNEIVVFYRTNAQSRAFEDVFLQYHIPYVIVGGVSFYQRREIKDILAWLRMIQSGSDLVSFERTVNLPKRGIGDSTLEKMRSGASRENRSILAFCEMLVEEQPLQTPIKLTARQKEGLKEYVNHLNALRNLSQTCSLAELVTAAIDQTRYREHLELDPETMQERIENLNALVSKAAEWSSSSAADDLAKFLEELSLKSTLDEANESEQLRVNLMTIHNGKGLEFILTFLAGMEEDLFPHANSRGKPEALEEERRLCYVGMTRAREYLYLTHASIRFMWGVQRSQRASRFLMEIPKEFIEQIGRQPTTRLERPVSYEHERQKTPSMQHQTTFSAGDLVFHQQFGIGQIKEVLQSGAGLTYRIFFQKQQSEKSLVAEYASLTAL